MIPFKVNLILNDQFGILSLQAYPLSFFFIFCFFVFLTSVIFFKNFHFLKFFRAIFTFFKFL